MADDNNRDRQNSNQQEPGSQQTRGRDDRDSQQTTQNPGKKSNDDQDDIEETDEVETDAPASNPGKDRKPR